MRKYEYVSKAETLLDPDIVALLTAIHEFRGQQALFMEAKKDALDQLVDIAKIQSTDASNRIEGIYTTEERLRKIVMAKTAPRTRSEKEIAGYRDVLSTIHESYDYIPIKTSFILQLHRDLYKYTGESIGGQFKATDNEIAEIDAQGNKRVRFLPVSSWETPDNIDRLCEAYAHAASKPTVDPLLYIPMFILDFLCVHPFADGNGRMSRLITLLLLYRHGYYVGKYISIEKVINDSKESYYEALQESSQGWHDDNNDYRPFVRYLLGAIVAAYREFASRVELLSNRGLSKPEIVRETIKGTIGPITAAKIMEQCPDISATTVQRALGSLQKSGDIKKISGGRYTAYVWNEEKDS